MQFLQSHSHTALVHRPCNHGQRPFFELLAIGGFMGLVPSMLHSEKKKANSSAKGAVHEPSQTTQVGLKLGMVLGTKWPLSSVLK